MSIEDAIMGGIVFRGKKDFIFMMGHGDNVGSLL